MAIEEEREKVFERAFEEIYTETICMAKKNKELKEHLEAITKEKCHIGGTKEQGRDLTQSKAKVQELQKWLVTKEKDNNKMWGRLIC